MDISLEWFFKVPGLFILVGVVLIIIALIVFFLESKKEKVDRVTDNQNVETNTNIATPTVGFDVNQGVTSVTTPTENVIDASANVTPIPVVTTPIAPEISNSPNVSPIPVVAAPTENVINASPNIEPIPVVATPIVNPLNTSVVAENNNQQVTPPNDNNMANNQLNVVTPVENVTSEQVVSPVNPTVVPIQENIGEAINPTIPTTPIEPIPKSDTMGEVITPTPIENNVITPVEPVAPMPENNQVSEKTDVLQVVDNNALTPTINATTQEISVDNNEKVKEDIEEI